MSQGTNFMFQSILCKTVALLSVFALVSMVSEVATAQSGSTASVPGSLGGSVLQNSLPRQITGGSSSTQFGSVPSSTQFGGGSSSTQFGSVPSSTQFGGGSSSTQFNGGSSSTQFNGGSSSTQFNGGSSSTQFGGAPNQGCNNCGQQQAPPAEPPFDCSQCGLPPVPQINNSGFKYPPLRPTGLRGIMQNCPQRNRNCRRF